MLYEFLSAKILSFAVEQTLTLCNGCTAEVVDEDPGPITTVDFVAPQYGYSVGATGVRGATLRLLEGRFMFRLLSVSNLCCSIYSLCDLDGAKS